MIRYFTLIFIGVVFLGGCNVINPTEPVPTYVHIDSFRFADSAGNYGSTSHDINTIFAFYNGIQIGVYSLPCTFPVITTPGAQLVLQPGVALNGFNDQEGAYPFYAQAVNVLVPQPGKIINETPTTNYLPNTSLLFNDAFELNSGTQFSNYSGTVPMLSHTSDSAFEGQGSGLMNFTKNDSAEVVTVKPLTLPTGSSVFCEFNYRGNIPVSIGLIAISSSGGTVNTTVPEYNNIAFAPTPKWTKIYLSLTETISSFPASSYELVIKAAVPYGQANGYAQFDNIKIVTTK